MLLLLLLQAGCASYCTSAASSTARARRLQRGQVRLQRVPVQVIAIVTPTSHTSSALLGAYTALFGAAITLLGNGIFIPQYSFVSSAWTTLAAYGGMVLLGYFWGQRHYPIPYKSMTLVSIMLFAAILGYMALVYQEINPYIAYLTIPAYLLAVWLAEAPRNAARKNH